MDWNEFRYIEGFNGFSISSSKFKKILQITLIAFHIIKYNFSIIYGINESIAHLPIMSILSNI
jgi:hypothetical protein